MAARMSSLTFYIVGVLISCFAASSLSYTSIDDNPIRLVSDGLRDFEFSVFSIMDNILGDLSFARLISPPIEAIYQFGDSISDTGNLVHDNPPNGQLSSFAKFPYGETYFHKPTGRCSNGLLMIDYFAEFLNLPFLDAYLNKDGNFTHGVNFAVSGATALDTSTLAAKDIASSTTNRSLSVQLGWFKSHLDSICSDASECKRKLANALFLMGEIGGNDYNWALFQRKPLPKVYELVPEVVQAIKRAVKEVIDLGANRVVVPGNFPIGCMTVYLAIFETNDSTMYDELKCLKNLNSFAEFHNDQLQQAIRELRADHPNVIIIYLDYFSTLKGILQQATSFGFHKDTMLKACCGFGDNEYNFDFPKMCGNDGVPVCQNPEERVSWDGIHLTQHAYHVMAKSLMRHILFSLCNVA